MIQIPGWLFGLICSALGASILLLIRVAMSFAEVKALVAATKVQADTLTSKNEELTKIVNALDAEVKVLKALRAEDKDRPTPVSGIESYERHATPAPFRPKP